MECDFCGNRSNDVHQVCCPTGDQVCMECVRKQVINSTINCSQCEQQLGKKMKILIQLSLKSPQNQQRRPQNNMHQEQQMQNSFYRNNPNQYYGNNGYYPQQQQFYPNPYAPSQDQWHDIPQQMYQSRCYRPRNMPIPNQMNHPIQMQNGMQRNYGNDFACMNRDPSQYNGINPEHPLWNEACNDMGNFLKNPGFGLPQMQGNFDQEPQHVYRNGQMVKTSRFQNFTTDSLGESRSPARMSRSNSSINIRKNYNNNNF